MSQRQSKRRHREQRQAPGHQESAPGASHPLSDRWAATLQSAVPLRILSLYERGGVSRRDIIIAYLAGETLGTTADRYLNGTTTRQENAALFNLAARMLAVLSYLPGGVPEGWGCFDAASLLSGLIGPEAARRHVSEALRRAYAVPPSQEPLRELFRRSCKRGGEVRGSDPPIVYLTESDEPPDGAALARALVAYLAIDKFLTGWRRSQRGSSGQQVSASAPESIQQLSPLAIETLLAGQGDEARERNALAPSDRSSLQAHYQFCLERLAETSAREPGRIGTLFTFARANEAIRRAIYQHLAVLIACGQLFVIEDELPRSQDYRDLTLVLNSLLLVTAI